MDSAITVYIDEGGDPGVKDGLKWAESRYEWFTLGAYVVRSENVGRPVTVVDQILDEIKGNQRRDLHYAKLSQPTRLKVCSTLAKEHARGFCFATHKTNLREYTNQTLGMLNFATFYNWTTRLLLERVMFWYDEEIRAERLPLLPMRLIFSERGMHPYPHMMDYLFGTCVFQAEHGRFKKPPKCFVPAMMDRKFASVERHEALAGLQLADVIASAFFQAVNTVSPNWSLEPAKALKKLMAGVPHSKKDDVGLTAWPLSHQAALPVEARPILEHYGYQFR